MIDKFNFYDIYGYVLPGAGILAVLWLPIGLTKKTWPAADFGSAIIAAAIAYIAGHLLQMIANHALPSSVATGDDGHKRYPSDLALDPNTDLPQTVKAGIATLVKNKFHLAMDVENVGTKEIDSVRRAAFFLARQSLIRAKEASYAEQFEGMYALTRGLTIVFVAGFSYLAGWGLSIFHLQNAVAVAIVLTAIFLLVAITIAAYVLRSPEPQNRFSLEVCGGISLLLALLSIGYLLGGSYHVDSRHAVVFALLAVIMFFCCLRSYGTYHSFARSFALTVWRDFLAAGSDKDDKKKDEKGDQDQK